MDDPEFWVEQREAFERKFDNVTFHLADTNEHLATITEALERIAKILGRAHLGE